MRKVLKGGVRLIDQLLSAAQHITEISTDPECIARIQLSGATHTVDLGEVRISKGEPVLVLHLRNDRMPLLPIDGPNLEWALQLRRQVVYSFRQVAKVMQSDRQYSPVRAVYGASTLFSFLDHTGGTRMIQHLGFTILPYHRPFGRFGEFWENLFSWWLMWTYNEASLRSRQFWHLQRTEIWMMREDFIRRYGESVPG